MGPPGSLNAAAAEWYPQSAGKGDNPQAASGRVFHEARSSTQDPLSSYVQHLAQFFPEFSDRDLRRVLSVTNGDVTAAAAELLAVLDDDSAPPLPPESPQPSQAQTLHRQDIPAPLQDLISFPSLSRAADRNVVAADSRLSPSMGESHVVSSWMKAAAAGLNQLTLPTTRQLPHKALAAPSAHCMHNSTAPLSVPWVATGSTVSQQYSEARDTAGALARARNVCFEQATLAYQTGNKALAKQLGAKGRSFNDRMKAEHATASARIFSDRNPASANRLSMAGYRHTIDLHGLHVPEALQFLQDKLSAATAQQTLTVLYVLVGTGHHTKGSKAAVRLPAAVSAFLERKGYTYQEPQPGLLCVDLP